MFDSLAKQSTALYSEFRLDQMTEMETTRRTDQTFLPKTKSVARAVVNKKTDFVTGFSEILSAADHRTTQSKKSNFHYRHNSEAI